MKRVIFKCKYFEIKAREAVIVMITLLIILLLFFGLKGCERQEKKKEASQYTCEVVKGNLNALDTLLERSDLCSKKWRKDYRAYIERLEEQEKYIKNKKNTKFVKRQKELIHALKKFDKKQNNKNIKDLKKKIEVYQKTYKEQCVNKRG